MWPILMEVTTRAALNKPNWYASFVLAISISIKENDITGSTVQRKKFLIRKETETNRKPEITTCKIFFKQSF